MSFSKNPTLRYLIIDECLSSKQKRFWSPFELMAKFAAYDLQIELRSLKYDMQNMRESSQLNYFAPIAYCRTNKGYYYTEEGYSIHGDRLSHHDLMALVFITNLLEQLADDEMLQRVKGTVNKLSRQNKLLKPGTKQKENVISTEVRPYYKGIPYLSTLVEAIFKGQVLRIAYKKHTDEHSSEHEFHPYQLKPYNYRWYVRGYSSKHKDVIILALDRMEGITLSQTKYRDDVATSDKEYFYYTIGITKGKGPVEDIHLQFTPEQGHYIRTLHIHHTQKILRDDKQGLMISVQLIQNYELCQLLMSYMPNVKILQPVSLREKIVGMLRMGLAWNG
jgi:predicted DNA-binding transcriptional regulator YafY